jgi:hypothetical protein
MKLIADDQLAEGKEVNKPAPGPRRIIGPKRAESRNTSHGADTQTNCSSVEAKKKEKKKHPPMNKDPQLAQKFKTRYRLDPLKFPYHKEIMEYLETVDRHYTYKLDIDRNGMLYAIRLKCVWKLFKLQKTFRLAMETLILAVHLFDCFLLRSIDHLQEVNDKKLEKSFNLRSFVLESKPSDIPIVDPLEATAIAAIFASGKFEEIDPPKLPSLLEFATFDTQTIIQAEHQIFECIEYKVFNPSEESYISWMTSELTLNPKLRSHILKYLKIALLFNFLRRYNPRILILAILKYVIDRNYENLKTPFLGLISALNISEHEVLKVSVDFFTDFDIFGEFTSRNHLELLIIHLDNPNGV